MQANYNDFIGGYVQAIDASMFGLDAPYTPTVIDINRTDLLQMYAELNLGEVGDGKLKYRYGRQFLQYGVAASFVAAGLGQYVSQLRRSQADVHQQRLGH